MLQSVSKKKKDLRKLFLYAISQPVLDIEYRSQGTWSHFIIYIITVCSESMQKCCMQKMQYHKHLIPADIIASGTEFLRVLCSLLWQFVANY